MGDIAGIIAAVVVVLIALVTLRSVRIVPQAKARNVERLGRYTKTLQPGLNVIMPFIDRVKPLIDLREQVVSFTGQRVITEDNLVVSIDTVLFFQVTDPRAADYEIVNYIQAIEQLTATMLRSVIGSMDLEQTLTSRDKINTLLRGVLDDASGKWGIRVTRVEIRAIDPPQSVKDAMEKQMRAEREKRAAILTAEGVRQSQILTAEGDKQGTVLRAEGDKQSAILRAEGQAQAIQTVFQSIHANDPDPKLLAYQYLQTLPQIAQGPGNTVWMVPSELTSALKALSGAFGGGEERSEGKRAGSHHAGVSQNAAAEVESGHEVAADAEPDLPGALPVAAVLAQVPTVEAVLADAEADEPTAAAGLAAAAQTLGLEPLGTADGPDGGAANGSAGPAS
ncbi:MAG TPA: SPFH domain-containing protein [Streptosporangiaceae bacterium]|nr:SPFH domain-containing protein [Streptosporangiaceae bacterium]